MVHEHPGVYSSYDASSVIGGKKTARILGAAAVSTTGTANEVVTLTSYAEGVSAFGEDAEGTVGMAALLAALYRNGAAVVKAVKVSAATPTGYEAAFAALEQEAVDVIVCDSTSVDVQLKLRASVEKASGAQRERIGVVSGGASETAAKLVERAGKLNSERMVLTAPGDVRMAAAAAAVIAGESDPSVPVNGAVLAGFSGLSASYDDTQVDPLVPGGVTPRPPPPHDHRRGGGQDLARADDGADRGRRDPRAARVAACALRAQQEHRAGARGDPLAGDGGAGKQARAGDHRQLWRGEREGVGGRSDGVPGGVQLRGGARAQPHLPQRAHHGVRRKNMANTVLPLSSDIYLEVDGKKVAVVQSYTTRATRTSREIEAFGENEPVATIAGANKYTLELSRLYATDEAISDGINFYDLNDFSLVICKPDKRIIYSQCRWSSIEEAGKLGDPAAEKVTIIARKRMEIAS